MIQTSKDKLGRCARAFGRAVKCHQKGIYSGLFAAAAMGSVIAAYDFALQNNLGLTFTFAAIVPVLGDLSYRQFRDWWREQSESIRRQGSGYIIGQISGRAAAFSLVSGYVSHYGYAHSDPSMGQKALIGSFALLGVSIASWAFGDRLIRALRHSEALYRAPAGFYGARLHFIPNKIKPLEKLATREKSLKEKAKAFSEDRFFPADGQYCRGWAGFTVGRKVLAYAVMLGLFNVAEQTIDIENIMDYFRSNNGEAADITKIEKSPQFQFEN